MRTAPIARAVGRLLPILVLTAPALAGACSGPQGAGVMTDETPTAPEAAAPEAAPDASLPIVDPPKKDAATPPAPAGECSSETTQTKCVSCCSTKHEDGAAAYLMAAIDCMCLPANCAKDCATTLCEPTNPRDADPTCQKCLQARNSACAPSIQTACIAEPECVLFDGCVGNSNCTSKPN